MFDVTFIFVVAIAVVRRTMCIPHKLLNLPAQPANRLVVVRWLWKQHVWRRTERITRKLGLWPLVSVLYW